MTSIQYAWAIYSAGSLGCCVAAWWMFLWAWRFVRYSAVVTVAVILFTPYAIDSQTMQMAPALYTLLFEGMASGIESIKPLVKLMIGLWSISIILVLVFVVLTRRQQLQTVQHIKDDYDDDDFAEIPQKNNLPNLPSMASVTETPIRALRD
jgi:hypothetical protein